MSSLLAASPERPDQGRSGSDDLDADRVRDHVLRAQKFAFGPIQKTIDARRDRIRAAVDEADNARNEARELLEQHRASSRRRRASRPTSSPRRARSPTPRSSVRRRRRRSSASAASKTPASRSRPRRCAPSTRSAAKSRTSPCRRPQRVVGKVLDTADQRRLIEEAIEGLDFSALEGMVGVGGVFCRFRRRQGLPGATH